MSQSFWPTPWVLLSLWPVPLVFHDPTTTVVRQQHTRGSACTQAIRGGGASVVAFIRLFAPSPAPAEGLGQHSPARAMMVSQPYFSPAPPGACSALPEASLAQPRSFLLTVSCACCWHGRPPSLQGSCPPSQRMSSPHLPHTPHPFHLLLLHAWQDARQRGRTRSGHKAAWKAERHLNKYNVFRPFPLLLLRPLLTLRLSLYIDRRGLTRLCNAVRRT